jgi:hypothetical protein
MGDAKSGPVRERRETSVALTSTLHWFETDVLTEERNYQGLSRLSTELVRGDATRPPPRRVTLDIDSPTHTQRSIAGRHAGHRILDTLIGLMAVSLTGCAILDAAVAGNEFSALQEIKRQSDAGIVAVYRLVDERSFSRIKERLDRCRTSHPRFDGSVQCGFSHLDVYGWNQPRSNDPPDQMLLAWSVPVAVEVTRILAGVVRAAGFQVVDRTNESFQRTANAEPARRAISGKIRQCWLEITHTIPRPFVHQVMGSSTLDFELQVHDTTTGESVLTKRYSRYDPGKDITLAITRLMGEAMADTEMIRALQER